ncbi:hypothetical protein BDV24DRAFT_141231 [Aspergillus arachidicola]|uniref:Berberine/berberine-like domain-containing protein n=1 Tax=Aspergillus arachidicola TaxID=656916 RepID=A0A5N6XVU4_9EURO|nr:hypothetical protein BDV24DRAFT_141231 [Aspergillus arachidicola]
MSFSASMGAPGQAMLMNRSLHVQPDGSYNWRKRCIKMVLSLPRGFPAFWPPDQVDIERFFGGQKALRLRQLKARLDPNNLFHHALPGLSGY